MTTNAGSNWVNAAQWLDRWEKLETLTGGGQGDAFRARRVTDQKIGFLKTIKSKNDPERRARFFREASAYDTFLVDGIPRLIESNAHLHADTAFAPFVVTEFVEGPTLRTWREAQGGVSLETAVVVTRKLVGILEACHAAGCVHRDVKPDNIILEGSDPARPWLLDFGLNYHDLPEIDFQTEDWQEVGNRFLRLPELSAGSLLKQDPRSDLSFAAGILFYLITGEHPNVVQDAEGRLPHQRPRPLARLQAVAETRFARLAALFDSSFAPVIANRFSNARAMRDSLDKVIAGQQPGRSPEEDLAGILEVLDTSMERRRAQTVKSMTDTLQKVQAIFRDVQEELRGTLSLGQTGFGIDGEVGRNTLFWTRPGSKDQLLSTNYEVLAAGDELVIRMSGDTVFRTSLSTPDYGDDFREAVRSWLLTRIRSVVSDPNALPPEADNFMEVRPFASLQKAATEAARTGRRILAFVYDPAQPERGQLQYVLGYFLQNRRTRDTMNGAFVTALVPLSQLASVSKVLDDQSMERSRWVILDSALRPLEQAVIYANPQEGERIMAELSKRHGNA